MMLVAVGPVDGPGFEGDLQRRRDRPGGRHVGDRADGKPAAKFILDVDPKYINLIPANVDAEIKATTVFGNKYMSFSPPKNPTPQRISPNT